jgi:hypothetical protein
MKKLLLFIMAASLTVAAQGKGGGGGARGGPPAGAGPGVSGSSGTGHRPDTSGTHGRPETTGKPADRTDHRRDHEREQAALKDSQTNSGSFRMLEEKTGKSSDELKAMYAASGAKNYGQFVSAVVVSKNLGLDTTAVLEGLKTKSLGQTLKDMGVADQQAKAEMKKADAEVKASKRRN